MVDFIAIIIAVLGAGMIGLMVYVTFFMKVTTYPSGTAGGTVVKGQKKWYNFALLVLGGLFTILGIVKLIMSFLSPLKM